MPDQTTFRSIDDFRQAARADPATVLANAKVLESFDTEVKAPQGDSRSVLFTISTASVDRMDDTIALAGWKLDRYRKNPQVLYAHDSTALPVAKAPRVWIESERMKAEADFTPTPDAWPRFNETVFQFIKHGLLSATSVGFRPLKYAFADSQSRSFGIDFMEQELLEFSIVPVPANADCLIEGKSMGLDMAPFLEQAEAYVRRFGDPSRVTKLAESVLGSAGMPADFIAWAERSFAEKNLSLIATDRLTAINALPDELRADAKKAAGSKGASGLYRRCANRVEKAINGDEANEPVVEPADEKAVIEPTTEAPPEPVVEEASAEENVATGFSDIAARRLIALRNKIAS